MRLVIDAVAMSAGGRVLFRDLTTTVDPGEVIAIMGPSGSGKSTLIAGIAGLLPIDIGRIHFDGVSPEPTVHWLFQSTPLLGRRTAIDNIALVAEIRGTPRTEALTRSKALLDDLELGDRADQPVYRLSGGEKQRVAVARAFLSGVNLILADEPTASLDPISRGHVVAMLRRAASTGAMVIIATHDQWVADQCARVLDLTATNR